MLIKARYPNLLHGYDFFVLTLLIFNEFEDVYTFLCTDMTEEYGYTALHNAIITRNLKAVHKLTTSAAGCDLELRDSMGFTALHLATLQGNKDLVELLIQAGCNTNSRTKVSFLTFAEINKVLLPLEAKFVILFYCPYLKVNQSPHF